VKTLQESLEEQTATLERLEELQTLLETLESRAAGSETRMDALQATLNASDPTFGTLQRQIIIFKAMQLLNRSRLYLLGKNYGLAEMDVRNARLLLIDLRAQAAPAEQAVIDQWTRRLELAAENLNKSETLFASDVDAAWQMMMGGIDAALTLTPALQPPPASPTPTPPGTAAPGLPGTLTPWPTATLTPAP